MILYKCCDHCPDYCRYSDRHSLECHIEVDGRPCQGPQRGES